METISIKIEVQHPETDLDLSVPAGIQSAGKVISVCTVSTTAYRVVAEKAAGFVTMVAGLYRSVSTVVRRWAWHERQMFSRVMSRFHSERILHCGGLRL